MRLGFCALTLTLSAASLAAQTSSQTITGVLMDAACPAIASPSTGGVTENAMPRTTTAGPSHASATGTTGAATETAVTTRPAGKAATTEANEVTHAGRQTATSGLNNQPGVGSTSGATAASAAGTTGSAPAPGAGTTPGAGLTASAEGATGTVQRSRAAQTDRYADCGVKPTTTSFAIYSHDGTLFRLDEAGSSMVLRQAGSQGFEGKTEVVAVGTQRGDRFAVKSVQRNRAAHP